MHENQRRFHERILDVEKIFLDLRRHQLAFIDEGFAGQTADVVGLVKRRQTRSADGLPGLFANHVELALEQFLIFNAPGTDEYLLNVRLHLTRGFADLGVIDRNLAPAEHFQPFLGGHAFENFHQLTAALVPRQKHQSGAVLTLTRQLNADFPTLAVEELVGHLDQYPGAIARQRIGPYGPPVLQTVEQIQPLPDDVVGFIPLHVGDKTDTTVLFFMSRVIQPLLFGIVFNLHNGSG